MMDVVTRITFQNWHRGVERNQESEGINVELCEYKWDRVCLNHKLRESARPMPVYLSDKGESLQLHLMSLGI